MKADFMQHFVRGAAGKVRMLGSVKRNGPIKAQPIPLHDLDDCPLGLSVIAGPGEDEALLAVTAYL